MLRAIIFQLETIFYSILDLPSLEINVQEVRVHILDGKFSTGFISDLDFNLKNYFSIETTELIAFVERVPRRPVGNSFKVN